MTDANQAEATSGGCEAGGPDFDADENMQLDELIAENERLQKVFGDLDRRQTVLEEFIEVEYNEKFDSFLKNRERLINVMGLGQAENVDKIDGKRSAKSFELAKLLKVVKDQAANDSPAPGPSSSSSSSEPHQGQQKRGGFNPHFHGGKKFRRGGNFNRPY